jgi:hypothetical protein
MDIDHFLTIDATLISSLNILLFQSLIFIPILILVIIVATLVLHQC